MGCAEGAGNDGVELQRSALPGAPSDNCGRRRAACAYLGYRVSATQEFAASFRSGSLLRCGGLRVRCSLDCNRPGTWKCAEWDAGIESSYAVDTDRIAHICGSDDIAFCRCKVHEPCRRLFSSGSSCDLRHDVSCCKPGYLADLCVARIVESMPLYPDWFQQ